MKNYLSFGGGVNSVAMYLHLMDQGINFEAIFVDHGTDWPETYEYVEMFQGWLKDRERDPIRILKPLVTGYSNLYDYCLHYSIVPSFMFRWCTAKFKLRAIYKDIETPCLMMIGIDAGEAKRVKISSESGVENRWPLIEADITRAECEKIILAHGLPVPQKSGCFICPYQRPAQWKELRIRHPDLFCKAERLEKKNMEYRKSKGKKPLFLCQSPKASLRTIIKEKQVQVFKQDEYPPCECGL